MRTLRLEENDAVGFGEDGFAMQKACGGPVVQHAVREHCTEYKIRADLSQELDDEWDEHAEYSYFCAGEDCFGFDEKEVVIRG